LIGLIGVVFLNDAILSVSDKYDSLNERTQEISELMKLHIQRVWQYIRQLADHHHHHHHHHHHQI